MVQAVECLPSKFKALNSNPSSAKKQNKANTGLDHGRHSTHINFPLCLLMGNTYEKFKIF
jgi:hypothetical protein